MTEEEYEDATERLNEIVANMGGDRPDDMDMNVGALYEALVEVWNFCEARIKAELIDG